ncbi:methyltransferase domain-containing protein [Pseudomonas turukhanskensis]|nr:class I SAM-dependent methyltransferase [Pseudomonas turukhanskensis]
MHPSAMENGKFFFDTYVKPLNQATVADIGAQNVNGSLKDVFPENATYIGVDFVQGKGVDIIIDDPYKLPFEDNSLDAIVSSSCFEHSEFFWLLFNEIMRVLKPTGLFYLNAPSNGLFHRYPVDCWRFYPDSGNALANWGNRSGYNTVMLESYTSYQSNGLWNDFVAVFLKDRAHLDQHPHRILNSFQNYSNGFIHGQDGILNEQEFPEDGMKLRIISETVAGRLRLK